MKIAFFLGEYPVLSETFIVRQIAGMRDRGHEVTILVARLHRDREDPFSGTVPIKEVREHRASVGRAAQVAAQALLSANMRRRLGQLASSAYHRLGPPIADLLGAGGDLGSYDAIIAHFGQAGVRAQYLKDAGLLRGPIAVVFHGNDISGQQALQRYQPLSRKLFQSSDLLLPVSNLFRDRLLGWGAPASKVKTLRMGVDLARLAARDPDRPIRRPLRILSVGRFTEKKGLEYAIRGVKAANVSAELDIVGGGPLEGQLRTLASLPGNRVRLLGLQSHARCLALLADADIFLLPSVTASDGDMEGVPFVLMEAMAQGIPVLSTRHSGIPELIQDGVSGTLVDERDEMQIARSIEAIVQGRIDLPAMRRAARETIAREFDKDLQDERLETLLQGASDTARARERSAPARKFGSAAVALAPHDIS